MLLPLGLLSQGGGGAGGAAFELISTVYGTGSSGTITFSNLDTYSSTYKHLQLRIVGRSTANTNEAILGIRFNSDSGSNYSFHSLSGAGSSVVSSATTSTTSMQIATNSGTASNANAYGPNIIDIYDFANASKNKTVRSLRSNGVPAVGAVRVGLYSGLWISTSAITSLTIFDTNSSNFTTASRFSLFGIKG